jgi:hypothetical protein
MAIEYNMTANESHLNAKNASAAHASSHTVIHQGIRNYMEDILRNLQIELCKMWDSQLDNNFSNDLVVSMALLYLITPAEVDVTGNIRNGNSGDQIGDWRSLEAAILYHMGQDQPLSPSPVAVSERSSTSTASLLIQDMSTISVSDKVSSEKTAVYVPPPATVLLVQSQTAGLVGVIAIAMRLLERYDASTPVSPINSNHVRTNETPIVIMRDSLSQILGVYLLHNTINGMPASQLTNFVDWIAPKIFQLWHITPVSSHSNPSPTNCNNNHHHSHSKVGSLSLTSAGANMSEGFVRFYFSRLLDSFFAINYPNQSLTVNQHAFQMLESLCHDILKEYRPLDLVWQTLELSYLVEVLSVDMIDLYLQTIIDVILHVSNIWHLPLQRLGFRLLAYMITHRPNEIEVYVVKILTEIFRIYLFYEKQIISDISLSTEDTITVMKHEVKQLKYVISLYYPEKYHVWYLVMVQLEVDIFEHTPDISLFEQFQNKAQPHKASSGSPLPPLSGTGGSAKGSGSHHGQGQHHSIHSVHLQPLNASTAEPTDATGLSEGETRPRTHSKEDLQLFNEIHTSVEAFHQL